MFGMNPEQLKGIARWLATGIGFALMGVAAKVGVDEGTASAFFKSEAFVGVIIAALSLANNLISKKQSNLVINTANAVPSLEQVTITDAALRKQVEAKQPHVEVLS